MIQWWTNLGPDYQSRDQQLKGEYRILFLFHTIQVEKHAQEPVRYNVLWSSITEIELEM